MYVQSFKYSCFPKSFSLQQPEAVLRCSNRSVCNNHLQPCHNPGKPLTFRRQNRIFSLLFNPVLCSAGVYQALPGVPQRGPLWRSPAVLGLVPAASHETFKLVRLPAALRLIPPHLLTDWLALKTADGSQYQDCSGSADNRRGYFFLIVFT